MTTIGFYVRAGPEQGYGHITRSVALAQELRKRGCECLFRGNHTAVRRAGLEGFEPTPNHDIDLDVWVVDVSGGIPLKLATRMVPYAKVLVSLHGVGHPDGDLGRFLTDLVIYQGLTRKPYGLNWSGSDVLWYEGIKWLILRPEFRTRDAAKAPHDKPRIVVCGGGADPKNVTQKVLDALGSICGEVYAIIGPANRRHYWYPVGMQITDPTYMDEALAWGDVAVVSYGMTAFECLCLGLPTVALSISSDHAASADLAQLQSGGALVHLGQVEDVGPQYIRDTVASMLHHAPELSKRAREYVDGRGVERVADKILGTLEGRR
jgi:spore coat polysaccharide biosynthesis protein SpsF